MERAVVTVPRHNYDERVEKLIAQKAALVAYLRSKLEAEDWHAVQDAASDIREIEAVLKAVR